LLPSQLWALNKSPLFSANDSQKPRLLPAWRGNIDTINALVILLGQNATRIEMLGISEFQYIFSCFVL
jgi:hypothetical protein